MVCEEPVSELERTLRYSKIASVITATESAAVILLLCHFATWLSIQDVEPVVHSRDANDDYLIALAQVSRLNLVSGDDDLLALANHIPVSTPARFLGLLHMG